MGLLLLVLPCLACLFTFYFYLTLRYLPTIPTLPIFTPHPHTHTHTHTHTHVLHFTGYCAHFGTPHGHTQAGVMGWAGLIKNTVRIGGLFVFD